MNKQPSEGMNGATDPTRTNDSTEELLRAIAMLHEQVKSGTVIAISFLCISADGRTFKGSRTNGNYGTDCLLHTGLQRQASALVVGMENRDQQQHAQARLAQQKAAMEQQNAEQQADPAVPGS